MEMGIKFIDKKIWNFTLKVFLLFIIAITLPLSVNAADADQGKTTYIQDKLETARGYQIADSYSGAEMLLSQADEEAYDSIETDYNAFKNGAGAGGYYGNKDWQAFVALYMWFVGMNGETGKGSQVADVDVSFGDIWDNLDFGIQAHIEVWYQKIIFFVDPMYMNLSSDSKNTRVLTSVRSKLDVEMFLMDMAAGYRVAEIPLGSGSSQANNTQSSPSLAIDLYGGGRLISLDNTLRLTIDTPGGQIRQKQNLSETWFDFIIGTRMLFDITDSLLMSIKTDIGGFGLGFSSDIDWNFVANIGYELPWYGITPYVGYRVLYIDYKDGSGDNRFVYDVWHTGPQVGLGVQF